MRSSCSRRTKSPAVSTGGRPASPSRAGRFDGCQPVASSTPPQHDGCRRSASPESRRAAGQGGQLNAAKDLYGGMCLHGLDALRKPQGGPLRPQGAAQGSSGGRKRAAPPSTSLFRSAGRTGRNWRQPVLRQGLSSRRRGPASGESAAALSAARGADRQAGGPRPCAGSHDGRGGRLQMSAQATA